jgi:hypothetical protein
MSTMPDSGHRGAIEPPDTPAQGFAALSGLFLVALGVLALIFAGVSFDTVGSLANQPEFLIWTVSGWTTVLWIVMGALGLVSMARHDAARTYSLFAAAVFAVVAVWGFVDGSDVAGIFVADTTNNITHAILAGLALLAGMMPSQARTPREPTTRADRAAGARRFESSEGLRVGHRQ